MENMEQSANESEDCLREIAPGRFWQLRLSRWQAHMVYCVWIGLSCLIAKGTIDIAVSNWKYLVLALPGCFAVVYIWKVFVKRDYHWPGRPLGI